MQNQRSVHGYLSMNVHYLDHEILSERIIRVSKKKITDFLSRYDLYIAPQVGKSNVLADVFSKGVDQIGIYAINTCYVWE
jgi:hypothetical protein